MWVADSKLDRQTRRGLTALVFNGICGHSWDTLTAGAFLVGFAVAAGAGNFTIGLLTAIPLLAQVFQIPALLLLERWRKPKRMVFTIGPVSRSLWAFLALVPLFFSGQAALNALIIVLLVASSTGAFLGVAWNTWIRLFVPESIMGRYFASRLRVSIGVAVIVSLLAGFFVDWWGDRHPAEPLSAYSFVFGAGVAFAFLSLLFLSRVPARDLPPPDRNTSLLSIFQGPFRDANFRSLLIFLGVWGFSINLALPFFAAYMLKRLELPLFTVVVFTIVSQLSYVLFVNAWGRLADQAGNRAVLYACGLLMMGTMLLFPFTGVMQNRAFVLLMLTWAHIIGGMAIGGATLTTSNIALKLSPKGSAHAYLAANGLVASIAGALGPIVAGLLADFFAARSFTVHMSWTGPHGGWLVDVVNLKGLDFVFILAVVLAGLALHRLAFVKEEGQIEEKLGVEQVAQELTREVKSLTSIGGLRNLLTFPITLTSLARRTLWEPADETAEVPPR